MGIKGGHVRRCLLLVETPEVRPRWGDVIHFEDPWCGCLSRFWHCCFVLRGNPRCSLVTQQFVSNLDGIPPIPPTVLLQVGRNSEFCTTPFFPWIIGLVYGTRGYRKAPFHGKIEAFRFRFSRKNQSSDRSRRAEVRVRTPDATQSRVRMLRRLPNSEAVCIPGVGLSLGSTVQLLVRCLADVGSWRSSCCESCESWFKSHEFSAQGSVECNDQIWGTSGRFLLDSKLWSFLESWNLRNEDRVIGNCQCRSHSNGFIWWLVGGLEHFLFSHILGC